ncbi:MAG: HD domain-containing protein [Mediterraneibacter faecis]|nr:HD domain-containing protein [Mediterraneibacter faecis]MCI7722737.1 HD domain-containing protein [Mediterraneibacter faecis]
MIDLQYAKKAFENYLNDYDQKNEKIKLKIVHTYGVMECSKKITEDMELSAEDCELAQIIGLLHDIGRFEQLKCYNSFEPETMDHAAFGVRILFEERLIRRFVEENKWDEIIKTAIGHHSDYCLKGITNERELMHAQIIRDADKLDNCRVKLETAIDILMGVTAEQVGMSEITPEVMRQFKNHKSVLLETRKTKMDYWISYLAYFYDINFKATYESIRDNHYVDKIIGRIPYTNPDTGKQMEQIRNEMNLYIQNAINENGNYR